MATRQIPRRMTQVRAWRIQRGLSLADWARKLGCAIGALSDVETGRKAAGARIRAALVRETGLGEAHVNRACAAALRFRRPA